MHDKVFESFLEQQLADARALEAASDIFTLTVIGINAPPTHYLMEFHCKGLVRVDDEIVEANRFVVGVSFPPDYLRRPVDTARLLTWVHPREVWAPNQIGPFVCIGDVPPGTGIVDIAHQVYEIITYQKFTPIETDALNRAACIWTRRNLHRFPIDPRPLRRPPPMPSVLEEDNHSCS